MQRNKIVSLITIILAFSPFMAFADEQDTFTNKVKSTGKQVATATEDTAITAQVKAKFALESDIKSFDIHVTTTKHIVNLSGNVETQLQASRAVELAQSVKGVTDVNSNLTITNSNSFLNDAFMTAKVKGKIMQLGDDGKISSNNDLHVETTNGVVHIRGKVGNGKDIGIIEQFVGKMNGVKSVKTDIDVMKQ